MVSCKRNVWYNLSCLLQTYYCLSIIDELAGRREDVVNQGLQLDWSEGGCGKPGLAVGLVVVADCLWPNQLCQRSEGGCGKPGLAVGLVGGRMW